MSLFTSTSIVGELCSPTAIFESMSEINTICNDIALSQPALEALFELPELASQFDVVNTAPSVAMLEFVAKQKLDAIGIESYTVTQENIVKDGWLALMKFVEWLFGKVKGFFKTIYHWLAGSRGKIEEAVATAKVSADTAEDRTMGEEETKWRVSLCDAIYRNLDNLKTAPLPMKDSVVKEMEIAFDNLERDFKIDSERASRSGNDEEIGAIHKRLAHTKNLYRLLPEIASAISRSSSIVTNYEHLLKTISDSKLPLLKYRHIVENRLAALERNMGVYLRDTIKVLSGCANMVLSQTKLLVSRAPIDDLIDIGVYKEEVLKAGDRLRNSEPSPDGLREYNDFIVSLHKPNTTPQHNHGDLAQSFTKHHLILLIRANRFHEPIHRGSTIYEPERNKLIGVASFAYAYSDDDTEGAKRAAAMPCLTEPIDYTRADQILLHLTVHAKASITNPRADKLAIERSISPERSHVIRVQKRDFLAKPLTGSGFHTIY